MYETKNRTIMKTKLFSIFLMLAVFTFIPSMAQTDSLSNGTTPPDEIEAFSDTTSSQSGSVVSPSAPIDPDFDDFFDDEDGGPVNGQMFNTFWDGMDSSSFMGMFFVLAVLIIIFVISPIVIIGLILWFIYKNRKNRMRLAEMAMQNGQPIPDELMPKTVESPDDVRQKGIRQICLGIGLTFLLGWVAGKIGAGIGILILCIGLGNLFIARSSNNHNDFIGNERDLKERE
jgi:hypothetical protein